jgi:hypothetical protein
MNYFIDPKHKLLSFGRIVGNSMFIVGYGVLLFTSVEVGIIFRLIGNAMSWPYFQKIRMYDILAIRGFFATVEIVKLIQIWS